ncbi:MAG TPA: MFS transporter, partial [Thermoanaerobaculia bacterium]
AVAMLYWTLKATGSASLMGLLLTASTLPGVLLSPIGGAWADRFPRIRTILLSDLLSGVVMLTLALVMLRTQDPKIVIPMLFGVAVVEGVTRAFFVPAVGAAIPDLVPKSRLDAANSVNQLAGQGSVLLGQSVGGVLYSLLGARLLFFVDAISFFFSAGCSAFIRLPPPPPRPAAEGLGHAFRQFGTEIREGLSYVRHNQGLRGFLVAASGFNFFVVPIGVLLPFYVQDTLRADAAWYGFLLAAVTVGSILAYVSAGLLRLSGHARSRLIVAVMIGAPTPLTVIGFVTSRPLALVFAGAVGAMVGLVNVYSFSVVQATTPQELRGRVMGVLATLSGGLTPIGLALGGILGDLTGKNIPLVFGICGVSALVFTLSFMTRTAVREFLAYRDEPERPPATSEVA